MKNAIRIIFTLSLVVLFLSLCLGIISVGYSGIWLHTYNVFTERTKVADIELSELKTDIGGEYIDVSFKEYKQPTGLESVFGISSIKTSEKTYKIYGDSIYIGGPILKFKDELTLFNFKTMYKIAKIYGRYSDNTKEINRGDEASSNVSYDINDGYGDWKNVFEVYRSESFVGEIYRQFIDTTQLSEPGQFASNKPLKYELYISNTGFIWEFVQ